VDQKSIPTVINEEEDDKQTPSTAMAQKQATPTEKDNDTINVCIGWNDMTSKDWALFAKDAGNLNWRVTRRIAFKNIFNLIYCGAKLVQVQYCQAYKECGHGYKWKWNVLP
jgi:hypothetical protein